MDVLDQKTTNGNVVTVILTEADLTELAQGQALSMFDPELKGLFEVRKSTKIDRTFECGPEAFGLFLTAFQGRSRPLGEDAFAHDLAGGAGVLTFVHIDVGEKGTSGNTFALRTVELIPL